MAECCECSIDLNERVLLAGCEDAKLRVYSATSQESLATLAGHAADKMISCVKLLSPSTALTGSADRTLKLWDLVSSVLLVFVC
eukprot:SAG11_NODE_222_length_12140_cov_26.886554_2_plen_84_part_00